VNLVCLFYELVSLVCEHLVAQWLWQLLALYLCLQLRLALVGRSSPRDRQAFKVRRALTAMVVILAVVVRHKLANCVVR
jgi:hypothetical protein